MAHTILVAEDQADIRELLVMSLRNANYDVQAVGDGLAALRSQEAQASDLLVRSNIIDTQAVGFDHVDATASRTSTQRGNFGFQSIGRGS